MTAFEYMATLGNIKHVRFMRVGGLSFARFTVESDIGPWRDCQCLITEESGEVREVELPPSAVERARLEGNGKPTPAFGPGL